MLLCYNMVYGFCSISEKALICTECSIFLTTNGYCLWSEHGHAAYDFIASVQKDWAILWILSSLMCLLYLKKIKGILSPKPPTFTVAPEHLLLLHSNMSQLSLYQSIAGLKLSWFWLG